MYVIICIRAWQTVYAMLKFSMTLHTKNFFKRNSNFLKQIFFLKSFNSLFFVICVTSFGVLSSLCFVSVAFSVFNHLYTYVGMCRQQFCTYEKYLNVTSSSISNTYTMLCPSVLGNNPRALARGLAPVKMDIQRTLVITTLFVTKEFAVKSNLLL